MITCVPSPMLFLGTSSTFPTCARGYTFPAPIRGGDVATHVESIGSFKKESLAAGGLTRVAEGSAVVTTLDRRVGLARQNGTGWIRTPEKEAPKGYHANRLCLHADKVVCANVHGRMYSWLRVVLILNDLIRANAGEIENPSLILSMTCRNEWARYGMGKRGVREGCQEILNRVVTSLSGAQVLVPSGRPSLHVR
jgi:hypothetical protein